MANGDLINAKEMKRHVPEWVLSIGYTLLFLSVFINSIGLNLMQINGALTDKVVRTLEGGDSIYKAEIESLTLKVSEQQIEIDEQQIEIDTLKKDSHESGAKI